MNTKKLNNSYATERFDQKIRFYINKINFQKRIEYGK